MKIVRADEPLPLAPLVGLIYGQPGIGKTSLAQTAEDPLLLDFDKGIHRAAFRRDYVPVDTWKDVLSIKPEDMRPYRTIQGYGAMAAAFLSWLDRVRSLGLDVIIVAHDKEDRGGDEVAIRPKIQGSSYGEVVQVADFVGYVYQSSATVQTLSFQPSPTWVGKNPAGLDPIELPDLRDGRDFLARIIEQTKKVLTERAEEARRARLEAEAEFAAWAEKIRAAGDADALTSVFAEVAKAGPASKPRLWREVFQPHAKSLGVEFDTDAKRFAPPGFGGEPEQKAGPAPAPPAEEPKAKTTKAKGTDNGKGQATLTDTPAEPTDDGPMVRLMDLVASCEDAEGLTSVFAVAGQENLTAGDRRDFMAALHARGDALACRFVASESRFATVEDLAFA